MHPGLPATGRAHRAPPTTTTKENLPTASKAAGPKVKVKVKVQGKAKAKAKAKGGIRAKDKVKDKNMAKGKGNGKGQDSSSSRGAGAGAGGKPRGKATGVARDGGKRLHIQFESYGTVPADRSPPTLPGTKLFPDRLVIPNNMVASYSAFGHQWRVSVRYAESHEGQLPRQQAPKAISVRFRAEILGTDIDIEHCEDLAQALSRERVGRTVCSRVIFQALKSRAEQLQEMLADCAPNTAEHDMLTKLLVQCSPARFADGILYFGLRHRELQKFHAGCTAS